MAAESAANRLTHQAAKEEEKKRRRQRLGPKCAGRQVAGVEQGMVEIMAGLGHQSAGLAGTRMTRAKLDLRRLFRAQPRGGGTEGEKTHKRTNKKASDLLLIFKRTVELVEV